MRFNVGDKKSYIGIDVNIRYFGMILSRFGVGQIFIKFPNRM
jgi:hypothetical protein